MLCMLTRDKIPIKVEWTFLWPSSIKTALQQHRIRALHALQDIVIIIFFTSVGMFPRKQKINEEN